MDDFYDDWIDQSLNRYLTSESENISEGTLISNVVKEYPDMLQIYIYHNSYRLPSRSNDEGRKLEKQYKKEYSIHRSTRRSKIAVKDIIMCNDWQYWCTFTFNCMNCPVNLNGEKCKNKPCICDQESCKRFDMNYCRRKMSLWLDRQKGLKYIIVPEFHKSGALHFHALLSNYQGTLKPTSKTTKTGSPIYNSSYRGGFNEFVKIDDNKQALALYMIKQYITKDMPLFHSRKRYWTSRNLNRPTSHVNGLSKYKLWHLVRYTKPLFINENYEIHRIPKPSHVSLNTDTNYQLL